ncbi:helix-turn-helix transcriptional regulator [Anaerobium acetethylicum]|uniref:AraC-type DNA-binding protein n=1 Tax=Anaerobium acetethylicum TaxID=1619234 RepID=A0A1D3TS04_9FIRM|nr:AraC family transcriptional regulator [Anaerobium acetethylicum]SCP96565.1 AraC-type DNA-binding protein [Anaerobium acetethylicum]
MEKVTYFAETEGISLEHIVRYGKFDMRVKHFHNEYEIFYIIEGERLFFFNNRSFVATKGDLILVNSNLIHMTKSVSEKDTGHNRIILYISNQKMAHLEQLCPTLQLTRFFDEHYGVYHLSQPQRNEFLAMYHFLKKEFNNRDRHYKLAIELKVLSYLLSVTRELKPQSQELPHSADKGKYRTAYAIADYLSANCEKQTSLEDLASHFFLSKYYICKVFKEVTGYTISEYVNIHRIQKAKRYLEETDLSITEIAHLLNFGSIAHFEKLFKTYMTVSPLKYRKRPNTVTHTNLPTLP